MAVSRPEPTNSSSLRDRRRRSGRKPLVQQAASGDLHVSRRLTWGMSGQDSERRVDRSSQMHVRFDEVNPSGMRGRLALDGRGFTGASSANLVIRADELTLPLEARISFAGSSCPDHLPNTVDPVMSESVVMTGDQTVTWNIDNTPTEITCRLELS